MTEEIKVTIFIKASTDAKRTEAFRLFSPIIEKFLIEPRNVQSLSSGPGFTLNFKIEVDSQQSECEDDIFD